MATFGLGGLPSAPDDQDFQTELDEALILPRRYLLSQDQAIPPVDNQHNSPMCGGYSGAGIRKQQEKADGHGWLNFDPEWLYYQAQAQDGIALPHTGTTARGVCKALQKVGARIKGKPGSETNFRIGKYTSIPWSYEAIKRSIFQYKTPVLIGASWFGSWFVPVNGILRRPDTHEGGHLFYAWGWDDDIKPPEGGARLGALINQNSWGRYSGSVNGRFYAPTQYIVPAIHDAWRMEDILT